ncbi:MAG: ELWxxDGT repeat protein [Acidobacteriota bacterium]
MSNKLNALFAVGWLTCGLLAISPLAADDGAIQVRDIAPGSSDSVPQNFFPFGDRMLFAATDRGDVGLELWSSDGTEDGTFLVKEIFPGVFGGVPQKFNALGETVIFVANDGVHGVELWRTDGDEDSTELILDIEPGPNDSLPDDFVAFGDHFFFTADTGAHGRELWITDGTEDGTRLVKDIRRGSTSSEPRDFTPFGDHLIFTADDGDAGRELWITDGTERGTEILADIDPGRSGSDPQQLTRFFDQVVFVANDGDHGLEPWITDGTERGTEILADIDPGRSGSDPEQLTAFGELLVFSADDGDFGREPWITDGSERGTEILADVHPDNFSSDPEQFRVLGDGTLLFVADNRVNGAELWRSDGSERGTEIVADIDPGAGDARISNLTTFGDFALFRARSEGIVLQLWITDGSERGTELRVDEDRRPVIPVIDPDGRLFTAVDDAIFFAAQDSAHGIELWRTDGTEDGTVLAADINPRGDSVPTQLTALGRQLLFTANDGDEGVELFAKAPNISVANLRIAEGDVGETLAEVEVRLSHPLDDEVVARLRTRGRSASSSSDFRSRTTRLEFAPGEVVRILEVPIRGDQQFEDDEIFEVEVGLPLIRAFAVAEPGEITIVNDDDPPRLTILDTTIEETDSGRRAVSFRVTLSPPSPQRVRVRATTFDDSATVADRDYIRRTRFVTIPANREEAVFKVFVRGDREVEGDERFGVLLSDPQGAVIAGGEAFCTILDNDVPAP